MQVRDIALCAGLAAALACGPALAAGEKPGITVEPDYQKMGRLLGRPTEGDNPKSIFLMGQSVEFGTGGAPNPAAGVPFYRRAAERGEVEAQYRLAAFHRAGLGGLRKDETLALTWLKRALAQGSADAAADIADAYEDGVLGLPRDAEEAYFHRLLQTRLLADEILRLERTAVTDWDITTVMLKRNVFLDMLSMQEEAPPEWLTLDKRRSLEARAAAFEVRREMPPGVR